MGQDADSNVGRGRTQRQGNDIAADDVKLPLVLHARVVTGSGGGPEKTILNSPRFLPPLGYRAICAYLRPPDDAGFEKIRAAATRWNAPLIEIEDSGPFDTSILSECLQICRDRNVAIWHGHDYKSNLLGLLLRPRRSMHLVTTVHGWGKHGPRTGLYYAIDRLCLPYYDRVICVSADLREECIRCGVSERKCSLIENAIDVQQYRRCIESREAKIRLGFDPSRTLIGAVGRLSEEKGYDILIRAVSQLVGNGENVQLVIIGEGEERPRLESLASELQLKGRVRLPGYCANPIEFYEAMDISVLSSLREGLPNVVLEAMAMEVPLVATRIAGVPRIVSHGANGLLVAPGSADEISRALQQLIESPDMRRQFAAAGRDTIERRYSFGVRMQKVATVYDSFYTRSQAQATYRHLEPVAN